MRNAVFCSLIVLLVTGCQHAPTHCCQTVTTPSTGSAYDQAAFVAEGLRFSEELRARHEDGLARAYLLQLESMVFNLGNAHKVGFKKTALPFSELVRATSRFGPAVPNESVGRLLQCSAPTCFPRELSEGELIQTSERLDIAILGGGFFEVQRSDGTRGYTRAGNLRTDRSGRLTTGEGWVLTGGFPPVPTGTTSIVFSPNGEVTYEGAGGRMTYRLTLVRFANPAALRPIGPVLFEETVEAGPAEVSTPGENGCGEIVQGFLEASNVSVVDELIQLIQARQACLDQERKVKLTAWRGATPP